MLKSLDLDFQRLWRYSIGFYGVWVAHIGREMGLFEALSKKAMTVAELAADTKFHRPAVEAWCSAALAYGFICSEPGGKVTFPKRMAPLLSEKSNPAYLGGQISYLALRSLNYAQMPRLFRTGKVGSLSDTSQAVEEATHWDHYAVIRSLARDQRLHRRLVKGCSLADIGCGTGSLLVKLCQIYPKSKYCGIEPSAKAAALARRALRGKSVTIERMKAEDMEFTEEFDIVYLGESLYATADKSKVLARCYRALKPEGTVAITEGLVPDRVPKEEDMIIMGMQIDFALQSQKFMTLPELKRLVLAAGFKAINAAPLGGSVYLVTARK